MKRTYKTKDKVVFYSHTSKEETFNKLSKDINTLYPDLKVFTRHIEATTTIEDIPKIDIFELLVILPTKIIKDFYHSFQTSGLFLKNEEPINPLKET